MFDLLENILHELKNVPGLSFLKQLHTQLVEKKSRIRMKMQDLNHRKNQFQDLSKKAGKLTKSAKGSKGRND